jgi:DNA-binding SARP family transcriptional activator
MLRAQLLGTLSLRVADEPVALRTAKVRELAAHLLWHAGEWIPRERLRALLWTDSTEVRAAANLRQSLYLLHRALDDAGVGGVLEVRRSDVRMTPNGHGLEVDAVTFRNLASGTADTSDAELARSTTAVSMYTGGLLEDIDSDWARADRRRVEELYLATLRNAIARLAEAGLYESAVPHARRWVEIEPTNEEAHRVLMRLHASSGYPAGALQQFEECRATLEAELGVTPGRETLDLCEEIGLKRGKPRKRARQAPTTTVPLYRNISDDPLYKAGLLLALGAAKGESGDVDEALAALAKARSIYERHDDAEGLARVALATAAAYVGSGTGPRPDLAVPHIEHALAHFRAREESPVYCRALHMAAFIAGACGDGERQFLLASEGLELAHRLKNRDYEARFETIMIVKYMVEFRFAEAAESLRHVGTLLPYIADPGDVALFMVYNACVPFLAGDLKLSEERHQELLAMVQTLPVGVGRAGVEIPARLLLMATYYLEGKQSRLRKLDPLPDLGPYLPEHARHVATLMMRPTDSVAACRAGADVVRAHLPAIMPEQVGLFIAQIGEFMTEFGLHEEAREWADIGVAYGTEAGWRAFTAAFLARRARALAALGDISGARRDHDRAAAERDPGDEWTRLNLVWARALIERAENAREASHATVAEALALCETLGFRLYVPLVEAIA